jgi:nitrous oxide reductase accessory protein NosL
MKLATLGAMVMLTAACGVTADGPPQIVVDRTPCSHCGMLISEPIYSAAYRATGSAARVFDDIGCLRDAARSEAGPIAYWFHDADDGGWVDGPQAWFVASPDIHTPMDGGLIAYRDRSAADRSAARRRHGRVVGSLSDLLTKESGT